jgi:hypothetical protein
MVSDLYSACKKFTMKGLVFLLVMSMAAAINVCAQSAEDITSITFTKQSRGFLDEVIISRDSVQGMFENHRVPESSQQYASGIDADGWSRLVLALQNVSLSDIDGLQSPTMNRAHDGAIHSSIVITLEDGSSVTHSFDDENPHPDLQPLLDEILQFRLSGNK